MPPPAPINPQIKPIIAPQTIDCTNRFVLETAAIFSFVVITGFTINFTPNSIVINTEKPPIVLEAIRLETQLPASVNTSTEHIITTPLRTSRFLFF